MTLHYTVTGEPAESPLVFLHGFLGTHRDWDTTIERLQDRHLCVGIDLPGHGKSPALTPLTFDAAADAVVDVLDTLHLEAPALIGYSMGGRVALYTALRHPARLGALALESTSPGLADPREREGRRVRDLQMALELEESDLAAFVRRWYGQSMFASLTKRKDLLEAVVSRRSAQNPAALAHALRALSPGVQPPLWDRLHELTIPTLLIAGEEDLKYMMIARDALIRILEQDSPSQTPTTHALAIVQHCGHTVHLEDPHSFSCHITDFLEQRAAP
jgi:2-succinyl-6-hydroxy-2,4-cyclohexadiene-1-carboxylate synthase